MKKILAFILSILMISSYMSLVAIAEDKVEISFKVGDSTLTINSTPVTVETPYVVGAGVTLVPVRVITEAFGAKVDWTAETQTVTIDYPQVKIILQIGNTIAEVNGRTETLLSAPELSPNGYTMVPLRFISETFGAEVGYDDETKAITVVKDNDNSTSDTVVGAIDSDYIGDSFFGWTMENPKDAYMDDRSFDGSYTSFTFDDESFIVITYYNTEEGYDLEKDFNDAKMAYRGYTLAKAEKSDDGNVKSIVIHAKDKESYIVEKCFVTDKYYASIFGLFTNNAEMIQKGIRIVDSFRIGFDSNAHDLSEVQDGYRVFKDETIGIEMKIPDDFYLSESDSMNEFSFYRDVNDDNGSQINIGLYSKTDDVTAKILAEKDYNHNKNLLNPDIFSFDEIKPVKYGGTECYEYRYNADLSYDYHNAVDVFFENGDYVYNISVRLDNKIDNQQAKIDAILGSMRVSAPDTATLGTVLRNNPDDSGMHEVKGTSWILSLPNSYSGSENAFLNYVNGTAMTIVVVPQNESLRTAREVNEEFVDGYTKQFDAEIIKKPSEKNINGRRWTVSETKITIGDETGNVLVYTIKENDKIYLLAFTVEEISYSPYTLEEINSIVGSFKTK